MSIDLLRPATLASIVKANEEQENINRKQASYVAYDIYNNNQHKYVMGCLKKDYPKESFESMRKFTSVNFARRLVDVEANIYKHNPHREFDAADDRVKEQLDNIYRHAGVNHNNKMANRFYKLDEQCAMMMVPNKKLGTIGMRKLQNWQYDVIPDPDWYTQALAYIIPVGLKPGEYAANQYYTTLSGSDNQNQINADKDDAALSNKEFILWSDDYNFRFRGDGRILTPKEDIKNPINMLPIIDISQPKQNSFLLGNDNNLSRFTVDFLVMLSDLVEIIRMQGYSQPIFSGLELPKEMWVGPHRVLFLQKKKNMSAEEKPEFAFATPNADIQGALDSMMSLLNMFLSSRGHKSNVVTGADSVQSFASGLERLLAMIEQHDSSIDDFELFRSVENQEFEIFKRYSNYLQDAKDFDLHPDIKMGMIPEDTTMTIDFHQPQMIETEREKQSRLNERLENGTISRVEYIMELDNVSEEVAFEAIEKADREIGGQAI